LKRGDETVLPESRFETTLRPGLETTEIDDEEIGIPDMEKESG